MLAVLWLAAPAFGKPDDMDARPASEHFSMDKSKMDAMLDFLPANERTPQVEDAFKKVESGGFDLPIQYEQAIQKFFTPTLKLSHLVDGIDPACLPQKCNKAFDACRRFDKGCEKRMECLQNEGPATCFDESLGQLSNEEAGLLMCGEKQGCVDFAITGMPGVGRPVPASLVQLSDGSFSFKAKEQAETRMYTKDEIRRKMDEIDASFAELDAKVRDLSGGDGDDDDEGYDLQKELGSIANSARVDDFDSVLAKMQDTQKSMAKSNQNLESLRLKLQGDMEKMKKRQASKEGAADALAPTLALATSFLETPTLEKLHAELGEFLAHVTQHVGQDEQQAKDEAKHLQTGLKAAKEALSMDDVLSPATRAALKAAGVPTSFAEEEEHAHAAEGEDSEAKVSAIDEHGNISPEALMALMQLKDFEMPRAEQWANIMKGYQEAAGKADSDNVTALVDGMGSFLQDAKAHGGLASVLQHAMHDELSHSLKTVVEDAKSKGKVLSDEQGPEIFMKALQGLDKGVPFKGTDSNALMASIATMTGLGMSGVGKEQLLDAAMHGPLAKYVKEMGLSPDSPLVDAATKFVLAGEKAPNAKAQAADQDQAAKAIDELMPSPEKLFGMALDIMKDPAALGELKKIGLAMPVMDDKEMAMIEQGMKAMQQGQMRTE